MFHSQLIQSKILAKPKGSIFSNMDFISDAKKGNIDIILHRMAKAKMIRYLGYGLYDVPKTSQLLGDLTPSPKDIIDAYSRKMGQTFVLDPLNSANMLNITTQVPAKLNYLTDGKTHLLRVCGIDIYLTHASPKILAGANTQVGVVIQALRYLIPQDPNDMVLSKIAEILTVDQILMLQSVKHQTLRGLTPYIDRITKIATIH
jgi:hypothetical protein